MVIDSMVSRSRSRALERVLPFPTQRRHSGSSSARIPERLRPVGRAADAARKKTAPTGVCRSEWTSSGGGSRTHEDTRHRRRRLHRLAPRARARRARRRGGRARQPRAPGPRRRAARPPRGRRADRGQRRRSRRSPTRALEGAERVVHLAAAVGVGQSMYEIARYTELNTMATARFLECVVAAAPDARPHGRRLVDVDLRRGRVRVRGARPRRARPAPRGAAARARVGDARARPAGASSSRVGTSEAKPLIPTSIYAINKRDHEEMCPRHRRGLRDPDGRPALLQRLRAGPGALEPVHRRRGDLRLAPAQRPPAGHLRGRRAVARLHARLGHRPGHPARARVRRGGRPRGQPRHRPPDLGRRGRRRSSRPGMGLDIEPVLNEQYRAGDIRHCFADPTRARELLGFEAEDDVRGRHGASSSSGCRTRRPRTRSTTPPRSWPRAAWPASEHRAITVTGPTKDQADVAIIIVSTNEAKWLEPCLSTVFAHAGDAKLDVVVVDNESTDGTRELVESKFPAARVVDSREQGLRPRQQPRRDDVHGALRPLPQPRHGDRRRDVRGAGRGARRAARRRDGRGPAAHRRRHAVADDPLLPERPRAPWARRSASERWPRAAAVGRRARARPRPSTRPRSSATGPRARSCSAGARRC